MILSNLPQEMQRFVLNSANQRDIAHPKTHLVEIISAILVILVRASIHSMVGHLNHIQSH
jgi:hypothetical protein